MLTSLFHFGPIKNNGRDPVPEDDVIKGFNNPNNMLYGGISVVGRHPFRCGRAGTPVDRSVNGPENENTHTKFYERHRYGGRTEKKQQQQNQQMDDIHGIIISIKMRILCSLPCAAQCDQFLFFSTLQVHLVFG